MWSPSHVHVIVQKAENLLIKGKNGTNNAFVVIELGKDSYRTSVKEKSGRSVIWSEECELKIPKSGNTASIVLTAYHRNSLGLDQFLGRVKIPLVSFDKFQKSTEWYKLNGKPGKEKGRDKPRGELEVEIDFTSRVQSQSLTSLPGKGKKSFERLTGSLFGLRHSDKKIGVRKFANTLGRTVMNKKKKEAMNDSVDNCIPLSNNLTEINNLDPGVISDDEEDTSHSESLANLSENPNDTITIPPIKPRRIYMKNPQISVSVWEDHGKPKSTLSLNVSQDSISSSGSRRHSPRLEEIQRRLTDRRRSSSCVDFSLLTSPKPQKKFSSSLYLEKNQIETHNKLSRLARKLKSLSHLSLSSDRKEDRTGDGCESNGKLDDNGIPKAEFKNKNKDELINMVVDLQKRVNCISVRVNDLEDYLDEILVKVMDTVPKILEKS